MVEAIPASEVSPEKQPATQLIQTNGAAAAQADHGEEDHSYEETTMNPEGFFADNNDQVSSRSYRLPQTS